MTYNAEELAFRARALAQAHPFTPLAKRFADAATATERETQPMPDVGVWAGVALTNGYCLRRVEENEVGLVLGAVDELTVDVERLSKEADAVALALRAGTMEDLLVDDERVVGALDRIIASEVGKRIETWRPQHDPDGRREFEQYIAWWVVKGYALRVAERAIGALA